MKKKMNCFLSSGNAEDIMQTVKELQASELVNKIYVLTPKPGGLKIAGCEELQAECLFSGQTMKTIATHSADAEYVLLSLKSTPLQPGLYALERMMQVAGSNSKTGMVYADRYQLTDGVRRQVPVIDYQTGSLRDDFDFGDRKSTRLNSSHANISYAVFCLKKTTHLQTPHLAALDECQRTPLDSVARAQRVDQAQLLPPGTGVESQIYQMPPAYGVVSPERL